VRRALLGGVQAWEEIGESESRAGHDSLSRIVG